MPGCPIFLNFGERLDKNLVQGSSNILEPWTLARLSTEPGYTGRLVNYSLSNIPTLERKTGQLACLSALLASWGKIRHVHLVPSSRIYEKGWTTCHLVQSFCIFQEERITILSKLPAFWRKVEQFARLSNPPAHGGKNRTMQIQCQLTQKGGGGRKSKLVPASGRQS